MGIYDREYYREDGIRLQPDWNGKSAISYLLILNIAFYIANVLFSQSEVFTSANQGIVNNALKLTAGDAGRPWLWWHTLSYAFAHDATDVWHLVFNMVGLYFLGRSVEDRYGKWEFLRIYLIAAITCGILWLLKAVAWSLPEKSSLLGASGAVICIEMLFVLNFPRQTVVLFVFPVPAWVLGVFLVLFNLMFRPSTGIAVDVHLIGILFAVAYFFLRWNFEFLQDLSGAFRRFKRRWMGPKLKVHQESDGGLEMDESEADRILAKIHEKGKDSLTGREKRFMEKYSRKVRERKQEPF